MTTTTQSTREFRMYTGANWQPEIRAVGDSLTITGYAAVFNRYSENLGGFVELIEPSAFTEAVNRNRVVGLVNHDPNWLLATTDSDTLKLEVDATGLRYTMQLDAADPDTSRIVAKINARKMPGSSFSFRVMPDGDTWEYTEQGFPLRRVRKVELYDVGPVTFPAYPATMEPDASVAMRSLVPLTGRSLDEIVGHAQAGELAKVLDTTANDVDTSADTDTDTNTDTDTDAAGEPAEVETEVDAERAAAHVAVEMRRLMLRDPNLALRS